MLLWQFLEFGWWTGIGVVRINAAHGCLVPPVILGAGVVYALDGLKTVRAYMLVILLGGLIAWGVASLHQLLTGMMPMPYALIYSPRSHFALLCGLLVGMVGAVASYELIRKSAPKLALPVSLLSGSATWLVGVSLIEYGLPMGWTNILLQGPGLGVAMAVPLSMAVAYYAWAVAGDMLLPARPIREIFSLWRGVESNTGEQQEQILEANRVISELRSLNLSLHEAERIRDHQMQSSPIGIFITHLDGVVVKHNQAALAIFGQGGQGAAGASLPTLLESRCNGKIDLAGLAEQPKGHTLAFKSFPRQWYDLTVLSTFDARGRRDGYHVMLKEVTEREASLQRQIMESRVREIHKTGKVLAHDFSNLLMGAQATLETLSMGQGGEAGAQIHIGQIRQALERGREMLSRLHSTTLFAPQLKPYDLCKLLREAASLCEVAASRKGVGLSWENLDAPLWVDVDSGLMVRVFTNLLNNAVRVTPAGGAVRLSAELDTQNSGVIACVCDNGPGMSQNQIDRAFDPGFTTKENGQGGLGLAISFLVVDAHGGSLQIKRNADAGVTVSVWLPSRLAAGRDPGVMLALADAASRQRVIAALEAQGMDVAEIEVVEEIAALLQDDPESWNVLVADAEFGAQVAGLDLPRALPVVIVDAGTAVARSKTADLGQAGEVAVCGRLADLVADALACQTEVSHRTDGGS